MKKWIWEHPFTVMGTIFLIGGIIIGYVGGSIARVIIDRAIKREYQRGFGMGEQHIINQMLKERAK